MKKAFKTTWEGIDSIVSAESASKARYRTFLSATDAGYRCKITQVRVVRAPKHDKWAELDNSYACWPETSLPKETP